MPRVVYPRFIFKFPPENEGRKRYFTIIPKESSRVARFAANYSPTTKIAGSREIKFSIKVIEKLSERERREEPE